MPPIVWVATCGHRNEVRSDHGGYPTGCKTCGTKVWVPKRGTGRAPSAREAAGRFGSKRSVAARARTRAADRLPRHAGFGDEAEAEAGEGVARRGRDGVAHRRESATWMLEDLVQMAGHREPTARRQPAGPAGDRVLDGTVIPPQSAPAISPGPGLAGKQSLTAKPLARPERQPGPEHGSHLVPQDWKLGPPCVGCRAGPRRAATWTRASWQIEMLVEAVAIGFPAVLQLCGNHVRQVPAEAVAARRRWEHGKWVLVRQGSPVQQGVPAPVVQPNTTIVLSGRY